MQAGYAGMLSGLAGLDLLPRLFPLGSLGAFLGMAAMVLLAECSVAGSWPVAWHGAWMPEITAPDERGAFLGWMRLASQLFNAATLAVLSFVVESRMTRQGFDVVVGVLSLYLVAAILLVRGIPEPSRDGGSRNATAEEAVRHGQLRWVLQELRSLLVDRGTVRLVALWTVALLGTMPLFASYASARLGLWTDAIARILAVPSLVVPVTLPLVGHAIDRVGYQRAMALAGPGPAS